MRFKQSATIKALLEASEHIENLCLANPEYGMHHIQAWKKTLQLATEELEGNLRIYKRRMKQ
jgi:hypothetical protein